jgi:hypothetical protein
MLSHRLGCARADQDMVRLRTVELLFHLRDPFTPVTRRINPSAYAARVPLRQTEFLYGGDH